MTNNLLEVRKLKAGYAGQALVEGLNLSIAAGQIVGLFGPNGAGKTTSLLTLAGELTPIDGDVFLFGRPTSEPLYKRVRQGLQYITDERSLIFGLTAGENLQLRGGSVNAALAYFPELEPHLSKKAALLSGGQQQMVALGRALAAKPRLLMVDELSMGLAPQLVSRLLTSLRQAADQGLGVLLVEQHVAQALEVCDRGVVLNQGAVVLSGTPEELREQQSDWASAYLGSPTSVSVGV